LPSSRAGAAADHRHLLVDQDAVDLGADFEHRVALTHHFARAAEAVIEERLEGRAQVERAQALALLRPVLDGRMERSTFGQQVLQAGGEAVGRYLRPH
jgi:hypothetical protein